MVNDDHFNTRFFYTYINQLFWPFVRVLALFSITPFSGEKQIPKRAKISLAYLTLFRRWLLAINTTNFNRFINGNNDANGTLFRVIC
ncbi:MAG TPA: flagellar biosynthetic protein FliR [Arsenophonus sp.]